MTEGKFSHRRVSNSIKLLPITEKRARLQVY